MGKQMQDMTLKQNENFLHNAYRKAVMPCMLSILCGNITILADGILVGQRIGVDGLAAVNLCVPISLILCVLGSFLVSGTAISASRSIGLGDYERGQKCYSTAIISSVIVSLIVTVIGIIFANPLVTLLGADDSLRKMVYEYTVITLIGALPKILLYVPFWFLRLDGRNGIVTWMMIVMGGGNVVLDLIFLYGLNMGVAGAAWASIISTAIACILGMVCLCDRHSEFKFRFKLLSDIKGWFEIAAAGSPSALNNLSQTFYILIVNSLLMAHGGSEMVAVFAAVNCIAAFSDSVTDGVPQAASAMLGVFHGEHDNGSTRLLIRREWKSGLVYSAIFSAVIILGSDLIAMAYGLDVSLREPMIYLAVSMFPGLWCSILSGYYNVSERPLFANIIIVLSVFVFPCLALLLLVNIGVTPWLFLMAGEILTLAVWFVGAKIAHKRRPECSKYLLMDETIDKKGRVLNFSVEGNDKNICYASERVSEFCEEVGMNAKQVIRISLAIEEIMTLLVNTNGNDPISFDVRVFSLQDVIGIRIRYNGKEFNPFHDVSEEEMEMYMGITMIKSMVEEILYKRTFGMNMVQLIL